MIRAGGQLGSGKEEFRTPNGLRISKNHELYVCDSRNNRDKFSTLTSTLNNHSESQTMEKGI